MLEEVSYITYDEIKMNIIVIFQSNYSMIVDLEESEDSLDPKYPTIEITNYTISELSLYNYLKIKKIRCNIDQ